MDKFRIDGHKLGWHVDRVASWQKGETTYPIYAEISASRSCNQRCVFCALDFRGYEPKTLDSEILKTRLTEMGGLGLKSVMYGGEGEPLLHKNIVDIIRHTKQVAGIDVALTTNGVLLRPSMAEAIMPQMEWIKVSINAGTAETYAMIHSTKKEDFTRVIDNLREANKLRVSNGYKIALGVQMLLLPENAGEACGLAALAKEIGMDYLVIKPYSQHPQSNTTRYKGVSYAGYAGLSEELDKISGNGFSVIFRMSSMIKHDEGAKSYSECHALPFMSYIDADGGVWGCNDFLGDERFYYGNIGENSFREIWEGPLRARSMEWVRKEMDLSRCRVNCRLDEVNKYLWSLKHPPQHVNFI